MRALLAGSRRHVRRPVLGDQSHGADDGTSIKAALNQHWIEMKGEGRERRRVRRERQRERPEDRRPHGIASRSWRWGADVGYCNVWLQIGFPTNDTPVCQGAEQDVDHAKSNQRAAPSPRIKHPLDQGDEHRGGEAAPERQRRDAAANIGGAKSPGNDRKCGFVERRRLQQAEEGDDKVKAPQVADLGPREEKKSCEQLMRRS